MVDPEYRNILERLATVEAVLNELKKAVSDGEGSVACRLSEIEKTLNRTQFQIGELSGKLIIISALISAAIAVVVRLINVN